MAKDEKKKTSIKKNKCLKSGKGKEKNKVKIERKEKPSMMKEESKGEKVELNKRPLTDKEKNELKEKLLKLRKDIEKRVSSISTEALKYPDRLNPEEDGTEEFERAFALELAGNEQETIREIEDALRRLEEGTFGICEVCGEPIEVSRIKAIPFVTQCIGCKRKEEQLSGKRYNIKIIKE